jgi:hypothetical protein
MYASCGKGMSFDLYNCQAFIVRGRIAILNINVCHLHGESRIVVWNVTNLKLPILRDKSTAYSCNCTMPTPLGEHCRRAGHISSTVYEW